MNIVVGEAQAWLETTKANLGSDLDADLEESIATQVLARVGLSYDTSTWVTPESTPKLVRKIIALKYASWYYQRQYSEDSETANDYALLLNAQAETLLAGVVDGSLDLPEAPEDGSVGTGYVEILPDPAFSMGRIF
jgi:hypothetical protein